MSQGGRLIEKEGAFVGPGRSGPRREMELKGHEFRAEDDLKGEMIIFRRKKGGLEGGLATPALLRFQYHIETFARRTDYFTG